MQITPRQLEVLLELIKGKSDKEIASKLYISSNTVKTHIVQLNNKLCVNTRTALTYECFRRSWFRFDEQGELVTNVEVVKRETSKTPLA